MPCNMRSTRQTMCDAAITMLNVSSGHDPAQFCPKRFGTSLEYLAQSCTKKIIRYATCDVLITMLNMPMNRVHNDFCPARSGRKLRVRSTVLHHETYLIGAV